MRLTVAGDTPTSAAICLPVWRWRRNASITAHVAGAVWLGNERGSGGAILQSIHAFCAEPLNPFGHDLGRYVELARGRSLAQAAFGNTAHHRLSTFGRQRRILVAVHLVSPRNTEASQPQLPRFGPDGQPPERPHLASAAGATDPDADRAANLHASLGAVDSDKSRTERSARIAGSSAFQREQPARGCGFVRLPIAGLLGQRDRGRQQRRGNDRKEAVSHPAFYRVSPAFATGRT